MLDTIAAAAAAATAVAVPVCSVAWLLIKMKVKSEIHEKVEPLQKSNQALKSQVDMLVKDLDEKSDSENRKFDRLFGKIEEVITQIGNLRHEMAKDYVTKPDCERNIAQCHLRNS